MSSLKSNVYFTLTVHLISYFKCPVVTRISSYCTDLTVLKVLRKKVQGGRKGEVGQTMYTHVSKCTNNKIKERKKKRKKVHEGGLDTRILWKGNFQFSTQ
jgi:hypothetical protein